jgi:hypothetical protein
MPTRWVKRKGHARRSPSGKTVHVRSSWALLETRGEKEKESYRHRCPVCDALILTVRMPNRGWVHYFAKKGLTRVKHPCLHLGEGMSRSRDTVTQDLFQN